MRGRESCASSPARVLINRPAAAPALYTQRDPSGGLSEPRLGYVFKNRSVSAERCDVRDASAYDVGADYGNGLYFHPRTGLFTKPSFEMPFRRDQARFHHRESRPAAGSSSGSSPSA